jgi:ribosome-associated translation inhibitor RaiA
MRIHVTARRCTVPPTLRDRGKSLLARLSQLTPFAQEGTIVFGIEGIRATAELRLRLSGGQLLVARGDGANHRTALDRAADRLRAQLEGPTAKPLRKRRGARIP